MSRTCILFTGSHLDGEDMRRRYLQFVTPILAVVLFAAALWLLHHELRTYSLREVVTHLRALSPRSVGLAVLLTVCSYFVLTFYDVLALRYIGRSLSYGRTALASFLGYVFSHNVGLSVLGASAARYQAYSAWGVTALEVASIVFFCGLTFWIGVCCVAGFVFIAEPITLPAALHMPITTTRPIGVVAVALLAAYLAGSFFGKKPLRVREWAFYWPGPRLALWQILLSSLDWTLAAAVMWVLLPSSPGLPLTTWVGLFTLAELAGFLSHVPGGVGVFETVIVLELSSMFPPPQILSALVAYRVVYYLMPLMVGLVLLVGMEVLRRRQRLLGLGQAVARWGPTLVPNAFALGALVTGSILLLSGATPAMWGRLRFLYDLLPLTVMEVSHFLGSMVGAGLLLLARGLQRRLDGAYVLTAVFLVFGSVFSLLKGGDYEEAAVSALVLAALLPCRQYFYRKASLLNQRFSIGWIIAMGVAVAASIWLGMFSYKHVDYSHEMWWQFSLEGNAPRFLRASVGVVGVLLLFSLAKLLRPGLSVAPASGRLQDVETVERIIERSPLTYAHLARLGDKSFLFNEGETAFIMYAVEGRSWVAMGDPVGPPDEHLGMIWQFRELCDRYGGWSAFYEVGGRALHPYLEAGLTLFKIGEQARVRLEDFSLHGPARRPLRQVLHRAEREQCEFRILESDEVAGRMPELREVSDLWLADRNTREKGFSLGWFNEDYVARCPVAVGVQGGRIIAFTNLWLGADREELAPDLMRHVPEAFNGVMEYLFVSLILWAKEQGYRWFDLGMAPLSGLAAHPLAPIWNRIGMLLFERGERFYNFQGLRAFKDKFGPCWEPRFIACPPGAFVPWLLKDIASLTSRGLKGVVGR